MERSLHRNKDLQLSISGLEEGSRRYAVTVHSSVIEGCAPEFAGDVSVEGTIRKLGVRYYVQLAITADATLVCDRSLETYTEPVERRIDVVFELDSTLAAEQEGVDLADVEIRGLFQDAQVIDVSDDVRQELALGLPMKRIAPQYRNQTIEEIFPDLQQSEDQPETRWEVLNKLKDRQS